ncbi:LacI family transcriptional regulator, partial [Rhizobium leguminosarum]
QTVFARPGPKPDAIFCGSDALRARVTDSIATLAYRPSRAARGLRGRSFTIGVLLIEIRNPFLPEVIAGVNGVLAPSNYQAM